VVASQCSAGFDVVAILWSRLQRSYNGTRDTGHTGDTDGTRDTGDTGFS
jgi:hypothetical protein